MFTIVAEASDAMQIGSPRQGGGQKSKRMTLHVFGSINIDHVNRLTHFPKGGETLVTNAYAVGLGGKGAGSAEIEAFLSENP